MTFSDIQMLKEFNSSRLALQCTIMLKWVVQIEEKIIEDKWV